MVVAVVTIPVLVRDLSVDRFGVLSLAWIIIGYFSLFDLGIGRALTKLVADKLGAHEDHAIPPLVWTSLLLMLLLGTVGGIVLLGTSAWLVRSALRVPPNLQPETLSSFYLLAISIPLVTVTSGLRGMLEAFQRFRMVNFIRIPMSVFSFAGPLMVLPFSRTLPPVIVVLLVGRVVGCAAHLLACFLVFPAMRAELRLDKSIVVPVLKFGGWMTVSNIVSPVMAYMDRFLIGGLLSVSAVAFYTAPFDTVTRLWMIPAAAATVLFPAFAVTLVDNAARSELLLKRGTKYILLAAFPLVLAIVVLAPEGLRFWLGPSFAENGGTVLRWLAAGVFVNSLAHVPFAFIQSGGRPDLTAKLHLFELPFYLVALWMLTARLGIQGAAIAWTSRNTFDACLIWFLTQRQLSRRSRFLARLAGITTMSFLTFYVGTIPANLQLRTTFLVVSLLLFAVVAWTRMLLPEERALLLRRHAILAGAACPVEHPQP